MNLRLVSPQEPSRPDAGEAFRYWAFLSYSHHDKAIAKRLQKQLETYRVPKRLVGRETSHGAVPARVSPVFRDRDELHAGSDLKASVQEALTRSRWLIVVCTPDSARSPWVNREIIEFKKLHGERRVLALIARGEPFASDVPGREAEECFPPALRRALTPEGKAEGETLEPIAADMRKQGDGAHRAALKLLAGMLGVPFDELVRRDVQRRVRWLTALAASSAVGVVVFAFLAVMAVQARNEAQYQRQQAEGLIEFMLGDLRKKLEPVGRLEVLDSVGEKALGYYSGQDASTLDANALGHRSRAMHLIGEIRDLRGQPVEAQKAFEQAAETTARLLVKDRGDPQRIFDHAQSVFWVGYAAWKRSDAKTAEAKFEDYLRLAQQLSSIDKGNLDWLAEVAFARVNLGMVQLGTERPTTALQSFGSAEGLLVELVEKKPDLRFDLAQVHGWQADAFELLGNYQKASAEQRNKLEVLRQAPGARENSQVQRGILLSWSMLSHYELAMGRLASAQDHVSQSLQAVRVLTAIDPHNLFWRGDECFVRLRQTEILLALGQRQAAKVELGRGKACVEGFNGAGSWSVQYAVRLNARLLTLSAALAAGDERADLAVRMNRFLAEVSGKLTADTPDRSRLAIDIANVAVSLGSLWKGFRPAEARAAWQRAELELMRYADLSDGAILTPLARATLELGDVQKARAMAARIEGSFYRHPAYADLAKQLAAVRGGGEYQHETSGAKK
ncbi:toll/interleukin-1 receptor domain-containing protein [Piscinibacter sp. HJYY11]|uniref:toll/interleukin-1 receptor domain-containing protein n=1 Tax=Piscinibacter sp. HJYY11 TaxID=2801333 RepID=UPI00191CC771|nr:toll/interleukin-1 receptor domain-containing protein [Piscinibacter sp. HJYY11]MBL0727546.1 toll/interleukin-1 receptor domain-containing protein [Piscinibacter sp. HJYY11]